jgi:hypothetical protein
VIELKGTFNVHDVATAAFDSPDLPAAEPERGGEVDALILEHDHAHAEPPQAATGRAPRVVDLSMGLTGNGSSDSIVPMPLHSG